MANNYSAIIPVMMARGLKTLRSRCVLPRRVNNDFADTPAGQGDTVNVTIVAPKTVTPVTPGATAVTPPDTSASKVPVVLREWHKTGFYFTDKERKEIDQGQSAKEMDSCMIALADFVNGKLFTLYKKAYGFAGVPGSTPFNGNLNESADARRVLAQQLAPDDSRRIVVVDPVAEANAIKYLSDAAKSGDQQALREGVIGRAHGMDWLMDQVVPFHTAGTGLGTITATVAAAYSAGNLTGGGSKDVQGRVGVIAIAATAAGTLVHGDMLTITGDSQTYTVLGEDVVNTSTNPGDVTYSGAGTKQILVSPAPRTVLASAAVTRLGSGRVNLAMHPDAIAFASRRLDSDGAADNEFTVADPVSGLTVRAEVSRQNKQTYVELDILFGFELLNPAYIARIYG